MEEHILKQDILSGYPHSHYYNNIHSIIENIKEVIFLDNENGWINTDGNKVDIGTWNKETRIATLDNKIDQRGKLFLIEVSNVTIDGAGVIIGDNHKKFLFSICLLKKMKNLLYQIEVVKLE